MAVSQLPQAPYRQDRRVYPTPIIGDVLFSEVRDCTRSEIPEYGTPHPNPKKWPDHKLVFVKPVDIERDGIFEFFYAAERENQDLYNFAFGNRVIGNREFRTVTRTYITLRENFKPVDIEFGTPMPDIPEDKFDGVSYVFYDKEQQNSQQEELNSLFVIEARSYVEAAVLDEQLSLSVERQDPLPPKFRVLSPTTTTEELAEGEVITPTLTGDQLAATEDQINTNLKRKRTISRSSAENVGSLNGKQVTNVLQVADVVESIVPDGTTIEATALTVDGSVEPLGNGQSLQRVITAPELFTAESYSTEKPDRVPEKFRAVAPTITEESNVVGTATKPVLSVGELAAEERQQNKFVKRTRKTKRDITTLPKSLTQKATTSQKQIATVTETLRVGDTSEQPSATVDIESEALGDGTYVVRKTEVTNVFGAQSFSKSQLTTLPEKFKTDVVTQSFNTNGTANIPTLSPNELSATEQQINQFVKRVESTTIPNLGSGSLTLEGKQAYVGGTEATVQESIQTSSEIDTGFLIEESTSTALGGGKFLKQTVKVDEWPVLTSATWDDTINALSIQQQTIKDNQTLSELRVPDTPKTKTYKALNKDRTVLVEEYAPEEIEEYLSISKSRVNLNVPPVLKDISILWQTDASEGDYSEQGADNVESITDGSVTVTSSGSSSSSGFVQPILNIETEQIWANDLRATNYFYFVKDPRNYLSQLNLLTRQAPTGDLPYNEISEWPVFKTSIYTVTTIGRGLDITERFSKSISNSISEDREAIGSSNGKGSSSKYSSNTDVVKIGPCLCAGLQLSNNIYSIDLKVTGPNGYERTSAVVGSVYPNILPPSGTVDIPREGLYVIDSRIEPYKWGYYKVIATVIDAQQFGT